jgi:8-oxo-dGTP diphosphatase
MIFAAGGLLWCDRADGEGRRLAVVHRPRYDDWSLPKGKVEPGEHLAETAVREVEEETGFAVSREGFAGRYQYTVDAGPKSVFVWHMRPVDDRGSPDEEVDDLAWLSPDEALDRLTYDLEREVVRRAASTTPDDTAAADTAATGVLDDLDALDDLDDSGGPDDQ